MSKNPRNYKIKYSLSKGDDNIVIDIHYLGYLKKV